MTSNSAKDFLQELQQSTIAVVGLGLSGMSVLKFLLANGIRPDVFDSREQPPIADNNKGYISRVTAKFGEFAEEQFVDYDYVIISPGISLKTPAISYALKTNDNVFCDVELFARLNDKPVVAVTGSNGKSTVVAWLEDFLKQLGINAVACGNYGVPVLDVFDVGYDQKPVDLYVMELSSFQLETTHSLQTKVSSVLNVTQDHMDRYDSFSEYSRTKLGIYEHSQLCLYNNDDFETKPLNNCNQVHAFGLAEQSHAEQYWRFDVDSNNLLLNGDTLGNLEQLSLAGTHNGLNALVVLALAKAVGVDVKQHFEQLAHFGGLPHRCQTIKKHNQVTYINDSKATNVASTVAAISGLAKQQSRSIVLIAGGDIKGADLSELAPFMKQHVKQLICFGKDKQAFSGLIEQERFLLVDNMQQAVIKAHDYLAAGDLCLLSPASASIDMYDNYTQRGNEFAQLVSQYIEDNQ